MIPFAWSVVPLLLAHVVLSLAYASSVAEPTPAPETAAFVLPQQPIVVALRPMWPFPQGPPNSLLYLGPNSVEAPTVSLPDGSTEVVDLLNFEAASSLQSVRIHFRDSSGTATLVPIGSGYVYIGGPAGLTISWSVQTDAGPVAMTRSMGSQEYVTVPIEPLASAIKITIDSIVAGSTTTARVWSDEYSEPTHGLYRMQAFLDFRTAFQLTFGPLNSNFTVAEEDNSAIPVALATIPAGAPSVFLDVLQHGLDAATNGALVANLEPYSDAEPDLLQVARLVIQNTSGSEYTVTWPTAGLSGAATAATFGLYEFIGDSPGGPIELHNEPLVLAAGTTWYSPGLVCTHLPVGFTVPDWCIPGSHDTDGFLEILDGVGDTLASYSASASPYVFLGPTASFTTDAVDLLIGSSTEAATLSITTNATSPTSQTLTDIVLDTTESAVQAISDAVGQLQVYISVGLVGTAVGAPVAVGAPGLASALFQISGGSATLALNLLTTIITGAVNKSLFVDLYLIPVAEGTPSTPEQAVALAAAMLQATMVMHASTTRYLPGAPQQSLMPLFRTPAPSGTIQAWAGGGGSLLQVPGGPFYGGASPLVVAPFEMTSAPSRVEIQVGPRGHRLGPRACSGGQSTYVLVDGVQIVMVGGGGGSALGSHGGPGGSTLGPSGIAQGYAGSTVAYDGPFGTSTVSGPISKPSGQPYQGSGGGSTVGGSNGNGGAGGRGGLGGFGLWPGGHGAILTETLVGAGGGGSSFVAPSGTLPACMAAPSTAAVVWPAWISAGSGVGLLAGPLGGSLGPYVPNPTLPSNDHFLAQYRFADRVSALRTLVDDVWGFARVHSWSKTFAKAAAAFAVTDGTLAEPDNKAIVMYPSDDAFVNAEVPSANYTVPSFVPVGPHDASLPVVVNGDEPVILEGLTVRGSARRRKDTTALSVDPTLQASLANGIYSAVAHMNVQTGAEAEPAETYQPEHWTLPFASPSAGPLQYLSEVWPATGINMLTFSRPGGPSTIQELDVVNVVTVNYSGTETAVQVPVWAKTVKITAFGGGGTSTSTSTSGADGSAVVATLKGLEGLQLWVSVGQGGGRPAVIDFSGGLGPNGTNSLGGGATKVRLSGTIKPVIVAAGGGSGAQRGHGVAESGHPSQTGVAFTKVGSGSVGALPDSSGSSSADANSGAGGAGWRWGLAGTNGLPGAAGASLVPQGASLEATTISKVPKWTTGVGKGSVAGVPASHGLVVFEFGP